MLEVSINKKAEWVSNDRVRLKQPFTKTLQATAYQKNCSLRTMSTITAVQHIVALRTWCLASSFHEIFRHNSFLRVDKIVIMGQKNTTQ